MRTLASIICKLLPFQLVSNYFSNSLQTCWFISFLPYITRFTFIIYSRQHSENLNFLANWILWRWSRKNWFCNNILTLSSSVQSRIIFQKLWRTFESTQTSFLKRSPQSVKFLWGFWHINWIGILFLVRHDSNLSLPWPESVEKAWCCKSFWHQSVSGLSTQSACEDWSKDVRLNWLWMWTWPWMSLDPDDFIITVNFSYLAFQSGAKFCLIGQTVLILSHLGSSYTLHDK